MHIHLERRLAAVLIILAAGCATDGDADGETSPPSFTVIAEGLQRPTQMVDGPNGTLLVAQLAGGENDTDGQVVTLDPSTGEVAIVLRGLDKPTGVLWRPGEVWVMVRRGLVRAEWSGAGPAGAVEVVLDGLPFNGRSEGTLTELDGTRFLYETTGSLAGDKPAEGSGTLWTFDPTDATSIAVATGLKNGYAHSFLADGRLVVTEIGDTSGSQPVEELNVLDPWPISTGYDVAVADFGWPACAAAERCDGVTAPLAVLPATSTPTGVAVVGDDVFVALFVTGQLVRVSVDGWTTGDEQRRPTVVAEGLQGPHTVLARGDGSLWLTEHLTGRIIQITP